MPYDAKKPFPKSSNCRAVFSYLYNKKKCLK
jgi:hypothetical protein